MSSFVAAVADAVVAVVVDVDGSISHFRKNDIAGPEETLTIGAVNKVQTRPDWTYDRIRSPRNILHLAQSGTKASQQPSLNLQWPPNPARPTAVEHQCRGVWRQPFRQTRSHSSHKRDDTLNP